MTWRTRLAEAGDAEEVVRLRRLMFVAMGIPVDDQRWEQRCIEYFRAGLGDKDLVGVVVDNPQRQGLAASGVVEIQRRIPSPVNVAGVRAYLSSVSTDRQWRRQGMARAVVNHLLRLLRGRGVAEVNLHATEHGRPLYASFGFSPREGEMVRRIDG